jgi:hypothetical protein
VGLLVSTDWKKIVGGLAPTIALALGGPLYGNATKFLADNLLGDPHATEDDIAKAISNATPETLAKLKEIDNDFKLQMAKTGVSLEEIALKDRDSARTAHKHSPMPAVICCALTLMVGMGAYMLFVLDIPLDNRGIANMLFGAVLAKWGDSVAYFVGTTRSSAEKTRHFIGNKHDY